MEILILTEIPNGFGRHIYIWRPDEGVRKTRMLLMAEYVFELILTTATGVSKFAM